MAAKSPVKPRLREYFEKEVSPALQEKFAFSVEIVHPTADPFRIAQHGAYPGVEMGFGLSANLTRVGGPLCRRQGIIGKGQ